MLWSSQPANYCKCLPSRLAYHFLNQKALRSETYQGITDAMGEGSSTGNNLGVEYILHSSFTGGPPYMVQNYHDDMAISRVHVLRISLLLLLVIQSGKRLVMLCLWSLLVFVGSSIYCYKSFSYEI
jgi:hypothetical protein